MSLARRAAATNRSGVASTLVLSRSIIEPDETMIGSVGSGSPAIRRASRSQAARFLALMVGIRLPFHFANISLPLRP